MTDAQPRLIDTGRGYTVRYKGKALYSSRDPKGSAARRVAELEIRPGTLVFVPSVGLGYGLAQLIEKLPDSCHILCIEADQSLFRLALDSSQDLPVDPALTVIRTTRPEQAAAIVHRLGPWRFRRVVPFHLCGGYQFHRRSYDRLLEAVEEEVRLFWQNRLTLMAMVRLWLKNLFTNLALLPHSGDIADLGTGRPILVCGAGPSLERSLGWIERIRKQVILMAVDTALPVLAAAQLVPDWVFTLDAQLYTLQDFLPLRDPRITLLCDLTSNPQSLRLFSRIFFFSTRFHPLALFDRLEAASLLPTALPPRGSVGVSAVEAALLITTGPVLAAGLDFSYPGQQTHARSSPFHQNMMRECTRLAPCGMSGYLTLLARPRLWLRDKRGQPLLTDLVLRSYALQLRQVTGEHPRVFDLSAEGLPIGAAPVETLGRLIDLCGTGPQETARPAERRPAVRRPAESPKADVAGLRRFYEQERELLSEVVRRIHQSDPNLSRVLAPVEYLRLCLPEADPQRTLGSTDLSRIEGLARRLSLHVERTRAALSASP